MYESIHKEEMISKLVNNLPALRALLDITQESLAELLGISRQTYMMIETGKTKLRWDTFVVLSMIFSSNASTMSFIEMLKLDINTVKKYLVLSFDDMSIAEKNYSIAQNKLNEYDTSIAAIHFEVAGEQFLKDNRLDDAIEAYEKAIYCLELDGECERVTEIQEIIKGLI